MRRLGFISKTLAVAVALGHTAPGFAQGCALCYSQAASAPSRFISGLRMGILVLIFPPLLISAALAAAAYRKRNRFSPPPDGSKIAVRGTNPLK